MTTPVVAPWDAERVIGLAPDAASAKAGRGQAVASKWSGLGVSGEAIWGDCQGSGKKPYQTCVELAGPAYRCSCPSRKFPCKHALGLLLLWSAGGVAAGPQPDWVGIWLDSRADRADRAEKRAAAPRDEQAAAKRAGDRLDRVLGGAAELREWLTDRVRAGLGTLGPDGVADLHGVAARMVDAQAPGLAGGLRRAASLLGRGRDWHGPLLTELALLHLLADAVTRLDDLPPALADTVRARLGFTVDTAKVLADGPRVTDDWLVVGIADEEHDRLVTRRVWLRGTRTGRAALVLSFAPAGRSIDSSIPAGHVLPAELAFHPAAAPVRAVIADRGDPVPVTDPPGDTVATALDSLADALAADPWLDRWPVLLSDVAATPMPDARTWALTDPTGASLPLIPGTDHWPLLALTATTPATLGAEWTPAGLHPLTCWHDSRAVRL
ncbi:SWIM zinc finger family protein [Actinokineospora enzanensis]|uniref:SWIM zinc finger family protein n=1 Tax=Actinokineospora enzanensis TaxID=155975 RepID=UPI00037C8947|nr:SWIM zinc finger family protein [Actinokineospora enzanensis]